MDSHTGREVKECASLVEIQRAKENDPFYQDLDKEDSKEAIDMLLAHQTEKCSNTCVTSS